MKNKKALTHIVKDFDAIKTMRALRDKISSEIMNMTAEEEIAYLNKKLKGDYR